MKRLNADKLHVNLRAEPCPEGEFLPRRYTLTHSDRTGDLYLTIGSEYDRSQIAGLYTRLMRDEVLAAWEWDGDHHALHLHCHVSGGVVLGTPGGRDAIFRRELTLVLEALRHGDAVLYLGHPELDQAAAIVHFHSNRPRFDRVESWGEMGEYA